LFILEVHYRCFADVSVSEAFLVHLSQTASDLSRNIQRQLYFAAARPSRKKRSWGRLID
jgi:hypothetical protein